jgi:phosphoribosylpyrophosphate synthetase
MGASLALAGVSACTRQPEERIVVSPDVGSIKRAIGQRGEGAALRKLQGLMETFAALTKTRNNLVHGFLAKELDGDAPISDAHRNERPLPTVAELHTLAKEIESHTKHLNLERRKGFLAKAFQRTGYLQ